MQGTSPAVPNELLVVLLSFVDEPLALLQCSRRVLALWANNAYVQRHWWTGRSRYRRSRLCAHWTLSFPHEMIAQDPTCLGVDINDLCGQIAIVAGKSKEAEQTARQVVGHYLSTGLLVLSMRNAVILQHCIQTGLVDLTRDLLRTMTLEDRIELAMYTDLMDLAVTRSHIDLVTVLLEYGLPPSWMALTSAATTAQTRAIRQLLSAEDPGPELPLLRWSLAYLVERGDGTAVELLLDCAQAVGHRATPEILHHALMIAVNVGSGAVVRALLMGGANASEQNWEAWYCCAHRGSVEVTVAIIELASPPSVLWSAAHSAEWTRMMKDLVRVGRDDLLDRCLLHLQESIPMSSARLSDVLVEAARSGCVRCGCLLLNAGALPFATVIEPGRALLEAAFHGHLAFTKLLLQCERPPVGFQLGPLLTDAVLIAADQGHFALVRVLLQVQGDVAMGVLDCMKWFRDGINKEILKDECNRVITIQGIMRRRNQQRLGIASAQAMMSPTPSLGSLSDLELDKLMRNDSDPELSISG